MKKLQGTMAAVVLGSLLGIAPAAAMEMPDDAVLLTHSTTCEGRIDQLQEHRDQKARVHADLNARQDRLEASAASLITQAKEEGISTLKLENVIAQSRKNEQKVDMAYKVLDGIWTTAQANACILTAEEFAKTVSYTSPAAQTFEKIGQAAGAYLETVVDPAMQELTDVVLSTR